MSRMSRLSLAVLLACSALALAAQTPAVDSALRAKADAGDAHAQLVVSQSYAQASDYAQAAVWLRRAADQGLAEAELQLGLLYDHGDGVPQSFPQAAGWYRKAALQNNAGAQYNLGVLYERGEGVPQDYAQAADLYRRAATQGLASAQFNLALLYDNGQGIERDFAQAAAWYRKAAEQGLPRAQYNLGSMYVSGQGVPRDLVEAYYWLDLAASTWSGSRQQQAIEARNKVGARLTPADLAAAQNRVAKWLAARQK